MEKYNKYSNDEVYRYIRNCQKPRKEFYFRNFFLSLIMLVNEGLFFYNSLQFDITGCMVDSNSSPSSSTSSSSSKIIINNSSSSTSNNDYYNLNKNNNNSDSNSRDSETDDFKLSTCINQKVQYCIPIMYSAEGNEALSFRVPLIDKYSSQLTLDNIYLIGCIILFLLIAICIARTMRILYIKRSRIQLLLTVNVLATKPKLTLEEKMFISGLSIMVVIYSILKLMIINDLVDTVSMINCENVNIQLQFQGKSTNSIVQSISNLFVFIYLFKDPIQDIYDKITNIFDDLKLVDAFILDNIILDNLSSHNIQTLPVSYIKKALNLYVHKHYQHENHTKRMKRTFIFTTFRNTTNHDILEAINEYKISHPQHFKPLLFNKDQENINNNNNNLVVNENFDSDNENSKLINKEY
ncbi:hypothetical protein DDB_G0278669 [Dictyostelium discoideum AX4]|uniref:Uncharacterized protein n=1 Tax=Dictyostelium discoideum TaxID=44689 RepID=Q54Y79_DICDI|nr:hypothetical protein DDB_G0278669 [Dictyostelium discoideum AX4]EAL68507.1 hypothetical protein DDB_G0278669 [Dictyostelium discoideum AX4]|eukprot:XP_642323.1 hypothetical protein DDB_G0278669 [Dictyostelium discoideum AX4]